MIQQGGGSVFSRSGGQASPSLFDAELVRWINGLKEFSVVVIGYMVDGDVVRRSVRERSAAG